MELQLVNFEQAKALKELGFPQETQYYDEMIYDEDGSLISCVCHSLSSSDYAAPSLELVAKWLREERSTDLYVRPYFEETDKGTYIKSGYTYEIETVPKECLKVYPNYEQALSVGIDKAIEILKNNEISNDLIK